MSRIASIAVAPLLAALLAPSARAEGFVDLRVGGAFTEDGDARIEVFGVPSPGFTTGYEDSVTGGVRGGYWFDFLPWLGVAADVSYFAPDTKGGPDVDVIPVSPLLMLRLALARNDEFPNGRLQPFAGVGPGIFVSIVELVDDDDFTDEDVAVGLDAHAGLNVQLTPTVSVFAQYRYTSFEVEANLQNVDIELDIDTHHVAAGLGFHF